MRVAFALDGGKGYAGAVIRQAQSDDPLEIELTLSDWGDRDTALAQIARVLSLDHDGEPFLEVGARDPVIGRLQRAHPGQRPVLFHSPYEAAAWAVISARRPAAQGARTQDAIGQKHGETFTLDGRTLHAFPQPDRLAWLHSICSQHVSDLTAAPVADTPKVMTDGNWRLGVFIDAAASDEQAEKLGGVFSGALGGPADAAVVRARCRTTRSHARSRA